MRCFAFAVGTWSSLWTQKLYSCATHKLLCYTKIFLQILFSLAYLQKAEWLFADIQDVYSKVCNFPKRRFCTFPSKLFLPFSMCQAHLRTEYSLFTPVWMP